jgi:anti-sigma regulatory factor (Ser/Thr protein kinase)
MAEEPGMGRQEERSSAARMRAPRHVDALSEIFEFSGEFFAANRLSAETRARTDFVIEELFTNVVKYNAEGSGAIEVGLRVEGEMLELTVTDFDSERFDLREAAEVEIDAPLEDRTPGGLGIHLVRQFAKRIDYDYTNRESRITIYLVLG